VFDVWSAENGDEVFFSLVVWLLLFLIISKGWSAVEKRRCVGVLRAFSPFV
jgi:hypothetical protein